MADIIQLLPDAIANQIAAGEVVQRPSSAVKELLENAIDAGGTQVKLIIKDAGRSLIQVIDNGKGMSPTDARLSFERHATSKIRNSEDLFSIRTMGFRGEALASIASIAQVEMKTRREEDELGTKIIIEGSEIKLIEPCQCPVGTNLAIKNVFFNAPARRKFLKSNLVEMRHILDEFQRIALANPEIHFSMHHNGQEVFHLPTGNLRQRVVNILGGNTNKKLVPLTEETESIRLSGFVGKPEFAKKARGEQFFFVNKRFIKSSYLNHAITSAYEELIAKDNFPLYVIFIEIQPDLIDVNVHPTKQEIKFEDERLVYNYLKVAVRHALGQHHVMPTLDFDQETSMMPYPVIGSNPNQERAVESYSSQQSSITIPSKANADLGQRKASTDVRQSENLRQWQKLYEDIDMFDIPKNDQQSISMSSKMDDLPTQSSDDDVLFSQNNQAATREPYQIHQTYIISPIKSGFLLIDQQAASERVLFERFLLQMENQQSNTQQLLFPHTLKLAQADTILLKELLEEINSIGFDIQEFGANTFVVHGLPSDLPSGQNETDLIEQLLEQFKLQGEISLNTTERLAQFMAKKVAVKKEPRFR